MTVPRYIVHGARSGWNSTEFNTVEFNSTPLGGDPPMHIVQYSPLGLGMGVLGESFGLKE